MNTHFHVVIAGTGFGGLGMAIRMKQAGMNDFVLLERAGEVGGVWRDNSYPGCACDVPSQLYSFSFAPNPNWTRAFSPQAEIHDYLKDCAHRFGLPPHIRFNHELREAKWQDDAQRWRILTSQGVITADVFISGVGALSDPSIPKLPGLERFGGKVMHSARWDHGYELARKKVAVIGTGASSIQFVPQIQPKVATLKLFQRTAPWIMPRGDHAIEESQRRLFRLSALAMKAKRAGIYGVRELMVLGFRNPGVMKLAHRLALKHLNRSVKDPALRRKLTPDYTLGCKRVLLSDDYLPSLVQPNVEVLTDGIKEVREGSIVTSDGVEHEVDALIFGTGFHVADLPIAKQVRGRDGRTLKETWAGSPKAHLGTTVTGFPNFFILQGPNTGLGHTSVLTMIESQFEHVLAALRYLAGHDAASLEPRPEAQDAFIAEVDKLMRGTVWTAGGCNSWYLDETGRNSTIWPSWTFTFARRVERFDPTEYRVAPRKNAGGASAAPKRRRWARSSVRPPGSEPAMLNTPEKNG